MTESETKSTEGTGRTPSMVASLFVFAVMISLIILSVIFFGSEVSEGALQVSMTLATLVALGVAYYYGFRGAVISDAILSSVNGTIGTIFVLLAIGAIIGALYLSGTVAAFVYYGVALLSPRLFYVIVFAIASVLSLLLGSSLTAIGAVGVAFVGLATIMGVSPGIAAGAAVSGAIFGDKTAKISDTAVLTVASIGGVTIDEHARTVMRTAIPVMIISALLFLVLGFTSSGDATATDPAQVQDVISQYFNVSLIAFLPVVLIFVLSALGFSGFLCLMIPAIFSVILAAFTQPQLIANLANDPGLNYWESVIKVGIDTFANGFHLNSGVDQLDQIFAGGGTAGMLTTIWLILVAAAFGAVADYTGMLHRVITPVINWAKGPGGLRLVTVLTSLGLNTVAADPYISIVLTSRMFRDEYKKDRLPPVSLSSAIADSGTIFSGIIPWNVNGALFAGALGLSTLSYAPFTFVAYLSPIITVIIGFLAYGKKTLPEGDDPDAVYGAEPAELPSPQRTA